MSLTKEEVEFLVAIVHEKWTVRDAKKVSLADRFLVPPFSVLDARQGYWQRRKNMWIALGIKSELGRGIDTTWGNTPSGQGTGDLSDKTYTDTAKRKNGLLGESEQARTHYKKPNATPGGSPLEAASLKGGKTQRGDGRGRPLAATKGSGKPGDLAAGFKAKTNNLAPGGTGANTCWFGVDGTDGNEGQSGTSIFDPVICELAYRWFTPVGGRVLDPFAGGSVRGILASLLQRRYVGIDLRQEQIEANVEQANAICGSYLPSWIVGDSVDVATLVDGTFDFVFSCPPYADLERYSDDPRDLSTMGYAEFLDQYRKIIIGSCALLSNNRFACFVVGDIRDRKTGMYRGFVQDTVTAFADAGLALYNEAVLVTSVGSLSIRVGRQFAGYRKLGKTHQNVLVFVKGDPAVASAACGPVLMTDHEMPSDGNENSVCVSREDVPTEMLETVERVSYADGDTLVLSTDPYVSSVLCDAVRCVCIENGLPLLRVWVRTNGAWIPVDEDKRMSFADGKVNPALFPRLQRATAFAPPVRRVT